MGSARALGSKVAGMFFVIAIALIITKGSEAVTVVSPFQVFLFAEITGHFYAGGTDWLIIQLLAGVFLHLNVPEEKELVVMKDFGKTAELVEHFKIRRGVENLIQTI